jgi:uncharacterized protein YndB with AHSA1/START domain
MREENDKNPSGKSSYQVDIQDTINVPARDVWNFLLSKRGLGIWLKTWKLDKWETGIHFTTEHGVKGKVRVFNPYSHIRLSWHPPHWENSSILEIRTLARNGGTLLHFHMEQLTTVAQKEEMEKYWMQVLDELFSVMKSG